MRILAIDPGSEQSAVVKYWDNSVQWYAILPNEEMVSTLTGLYLGDHLAIEYTKAHTLQFKGKNKSFFPQQVLDTARWVGRFEQAFSGPFTEIDRANVKRTLGVPSNGSDAHVKAALIDRWGGREAAIGAVKCSYCHGKGWIGRGRPTCEECGGVRWLHPPGPLHGLHADLWQALAVAVTFADTHDLSPVTEERER